MMARQDPALCTARAPIKRRIDILGLIEWAFQCECAELDFGDIDRLGAEARCGIGIEYLMMQRGPAGVRIDGGGRSWPHDDADLVADAVAHLPLTHGGRAMAVQIAELARAGARPDAMVGARVTARPEDWHANQNGMRPATADAAELGPYGWRAQPRRNRKGVIVHDRVPYTPIVFSPTPDQIGRARRNYLQWWGALLEVRQGLVISGLLATHELTDAMPPMTPWRKTY